MINQSQRIFDSNCHPSIYGTWLGQGSDYTFSDLNSIMKKNNISKALAVGLDSVDRYSHDLFIKEADKYDNIIPIAGLNPKVENSFSKINYLKKLGFKGVKIHPRFSNISLIDNKEKIRRVFQHCNKLNLVIMFCTYFYEKNCLIINNPIDYLKDLIDGLSKVKIVLMHSGYDKFKSYLSSFDNYENIIFDLSYTIMIKKTINLNESFKNCLKDYNRRVLIGSDWPEFDFSAVKKVLECYTDHLSKPEIDNIYFDNLNRIFSEKSR